MLSLSPSWTTCITDAIHLSNTLLDLALVPISKFVHANLEFMWACGNRSSTRTSRLKQLDASRSILLYTSMATTIRRQAAEPLPFDFPLCDRVALKVSMIPRG